MSFIYLDYSMGKKFDFLNPDSTPLTIEQIARGLSREFRWSNQSRLQITVAEHCIHCADMVFVPASQQLGVLLHDASEAVMRDISSPLKDLLPDYRMVEHRVQMSIWKSFGVEPPPPELIARVDRVAREFEAWGTKAPLNGDAPLGMVDAEEAYLQMFFDLWAKRPTSHFLATR